MRAFLKYIVRGRTQAITTAAACAAASLMFPPISYIGGAVVALVELRYGAKQAGLVVGGAVALLALLAYFVQGTPALAFSLAAIIWLPVWPIAVVLRGTNSQGLALTAAGAIAALGVLVCHVVFEDIGAWWSLILDEVLTAPLSQGELELDDETLGQFRRFIDMLAPMMVGIIAAGTMLGAIFSALLGRWWHALLDNPGGFGREFRALQLGRLVGSFTAVITVLALFANQATDGIALDFLLILVVMYSFQGLALIHALVHYRKAALGWLVALYVALAVMPHVALLVAVVGLTDSWIDWRKRWRPGALT